MLDALHHQLAEALEVWHSVYDDAHISREDCLACQALHAYNEAVEAERIQPETICPHCEGTGECGPIEMPRRCDWCKGSGVETIETEEEKDER